MMDDYRKSKVISSGEGNWLRRDTTSGVSEKTRVERNARTASRMADVTSMEAASQHRKGNHKDAERLSRTSRAAGKAAVDEYDSYD